MPAFPQCRKAVGNLSSSSPSCMQPIWVMQLNISGYRFFFDLSGMCEMFRKTTRIKHPCDPPLLVLSKATTTFICIICTPPHHEQKKRKGDFFNQLFCWLKNSMSVQNRKKKIPSNQVKAEEWKRSDKERKKKIDWLIAKPLEQHGKACFQSWFLRDLASTHLQWANTFGDHSIHWWL